MNEYDLDRLAYTGYNLLFVSEEFVTFTKNPINKISH